MNVIVLFSQNTRKIYIVDDKVKAKDSLTLNIDKDAEIYVSPFEPNKLMLSNIGNTIRITPRQYAQPYVLRLNLSEYNYIAIFNKSTMSYNFYPSKCNINFGLNSPRAADRSFSTIKIDSFNPFGCHDPEMAVAGGILSLLLKAIQK